MKLMDDQSQRIRYPSQAKKACVLSFSDIRHIHRPRFDNDWFDHLNYCHLELLRITDIIKYSHIEEGTPYKYCWYYIVVSGNSQLQIVQKN